MEIMETLNSLRRVRSELQDIQEDFEGMVGAIESATDVFDGAEAHLSSLLKDGDIARELNRIHRDKEQYLRDRSDEERKSALRERDEMWETRIEQLKARLEREYMVKEGAIAKKEIEHQCQNMKKHRSFSHI